MKQGSDHLLKIRVIRHLPIGLSVEAENGRRGIVRVRELSWQPDQAIGWEKAYPIGWKGKAVLLSSKEGQKCEFSLRLAENDPWENISDRIGGDKSFEGVVTGIVGYGVFIEIAPGITGLLHRSQFPHWVNAAPIDLFWPGDRVSVVIKEIRYQERKITLGLAANSHPPSETIGHESVLRDTNSEIDAFLKANGPRKHILMVEDDLEQAAYLSSWLRHLGQHVDAVESAQEAHTLLEKSPPDIAMISIGLLDMQGVELSNLILAQWPQVHVIATIDWTHTDEVMNIAEDLQRRGAALLTKPFLPEDLIGMLKTAAEQKNEIPPESEKISSPGFSLRDIPDIEPNRPLHSILRQYRRHMGFEQVVLFALDLAHQQVSIVDSSGDALLDKSVIPSLVYSPVRDLVETQEIIVRGEVPPYEQDRFRYLLEFYPELVACIGVPVTARTQSDYALFAFDKRSRQISAEQKIYAEAMALVIGTYLEQETFREKSMLVQQAALIGHLTRGMVHEMNNLMQTLTSRLEILSATLKRLEKNRDQPNLPDADSHTIAGELVEIQKYVRKTIGTIDMFTRIAAKGKDEVLRVDEVIEGTIRFMRYISNRAHVKVVFVPPERLVVIKNQVVALEQVLLNVLLNAVQQIAELRPDSGGWIQIRIDLSSIGKDGNFFRVLIEDNGPGIHTKLWERIFDVGYTTRSDGSGIGLYISRNLMNELGGRIYVAESRILGGTTFALHIPYRL